MKKIILTGGGTAGHVTPNIALMPKLESYGYQISYIGSKNGIEKDLIENCQIPYYGISAGKLRRYLSMENITDIFRIVKGVGDANKIIKKVKPDIIFSKGGFVTVPVVIAGKLNGVPVVLHESDMTPGLANKIAIPFSKYVCVSFPETINNLPEDKTILTGSPIREDLFYGSKNKGFSKFKLSGIKPVLLVMGGSLGSVAINNALRGILDELLLEFDIIHLCGKGNKDDSIKKKGYLQFEYLSDDLNHAFACADIIISRAGANSIFEFLALKKPNILIPLTKKASRGDQILNALSFKQQGFSEVIFEEDLTNSHLLETIRMVYSNRYQYISNMEKTNLNNGVNEVSKIILKEAR